MFDAQQSLDFTQDDALYPEVNRFESNRITEHLPAPPSQTTVGGFERPERPVENPDSEGSSMGHAPLLIDAIQSSSCSRQTHRDEHTAHYMQQQDALLNENWDISALVTKYSIEAIKNKNSQINASGDASTTPRRARLDTDSSNSNSVSQLMNTMLPLSMMSPAKMNNNSNNNNPSTHTHITHHGTSQHQSIFSSLPTYAVEVKDAVVAIQVQCCRFDKIISSSGGHNASGFLSGRKCPESVESPNSDTSNLTPSSPQIPYDKTQYFQQQLQHLNNLERAHKLEDAEACLADLCEMTLPERYHNDFKCKISF
eukprot:gene35975-44365_t